MSDHCGVSGDTQQLAIWEGKGGSTTRPTLARGRSVHCRHIYNEVEAMHTRMMRSLLAPSAEGSGSARLYVGAEAISASERADLLKEFRTRGSKSAGSEGDAADSEGDEDDTRRDLKAEARSLRHMMTHLPKNKYCPYCRWAKAINLHARKRSKKKKAALGEDFEGVMDALLDKVSACERVRG